MFDNTFSAAAEWDGDPDAAGLMMRDLSTGMWVEYDPWWSPEDVDVVPLEVLLDDPDPGEPSLDELPGGWDAPAPPWDEWPPVDTTTNSTDTDTDEGASGHAGDRDDDDTHSAAGHAADHHDNTGADTDTDIDADEGAAGHDADTDARGPVSVPAGLTSMPPGPDLAATLADIPVRRVSGHDTVDVMAATYRQASHARAVFLKALLETGMRQPGSADTVSRVTHPGEFAAEEARTALVWSRRRADGTFEFAFDIHERLPMLGTAMLAGVLDEPRARAFVQWTTGLTDDQAAHIITTLLPQAAGMPVGALVDRIKRMAIAIDPAWAQRRYRQAVRGRRVEGSRNDDGTANIAGLDLPVDRAAAACDRIDALARACKHAGDSRPVDHVRTDLYLGMLDGTYEHLDEDEIVAYVLTHPFTDEPSDTEPDGPSGGGGDDGGTGDGGDGPAGRDGGDGPGGGDGGSPSDGDDGHHDSDGDDEDPGGTGAEDGGPSGGDGHDGHDGDGSGGQDGGPGSGGSNPANHRGSGPDRDHSSSGHDGTDGTGSDGGPDDRDTGPDDSGADDEPHHHDRPADSAAVDSGGEASRGRAGDDPRAASRGPDTTAPETRTPEPGAPAATGPAPPDSDGSRSQPPGPAPPDTDRFRSQPAGSQPAESGATGWSVRELRVEIAALLGLNEHPAEIVGWDYVPATLARALIGSMRGAQWRWVICDQHGRLIDSGITRKRPHPPPGAGGTGQRPPPPRRDTGRRAGIVELQLRADDLPVLAAATGGEGPNAAWAAVIADIASQHHTTADIVDDEDDAADTAEGADMTDTAGEDSAAAARDARRRSARAGLRRRVQIRDRSCVHPACRTPATRTDQDHAQEHAHGGPTTEENLGCCCRHDHRLRHDGGWRIWKPTPDTTIWGSPLGHSYLNRPPPVMPALPKPWPRPAADTTAMPLAVAPSLAPGNAATPARTINPTTDTPPF